MAYLEQCTAEQVADSVEAVTVAGRPCSASEIAEFVNHPVATIERATSVAVALGLLVADGDSFSVSPTYSLDFSGASEPPGIAVWRCALEGSPPYRFFKRRLAFHKDQMQAARETKLRFRFDNHEAEIAATLMSLGQ